MKIKYLLVALSVFLAGCASTFGSSSRICGEGYDFKFGDKIVVSNISLPQKSSSPFFYLFEKHYAVIMQQDEVVSFLNKNKYFGELSLLLQKIKDELPLKENTDIKKYGLETAFLISTSRRVAADLIESGKAMVIDMRYGKSGEPLKEVALVRLENGGNFRLVCDVSKNLIFEVTDSIE